jgi:hypothetical protein
MGDRGLMEKEAAAEALQGSHVPVVATTQKTIKDKNGKKNEENKINSCQLSDGSFNQPQNQPLRIYGRKNDRRKSPRYHC